MGNNIAMLNKILLIDALCGMYISPRVAELVPSRLLNGNREGDFKVNREELYAYTADELYAIYQIFCESGRATGLYEGWNPICPVAVRYNEECSRFLNERNRLMNCSDLDGMINDELTGNIDFAIIYHIINGDYDLEAANQAWCEEKFREVINQLK